MLATIAAGVMALVLALVIPVRADTKGDPAMTVISKHPAVCAMPIEAIGRSPKSYPENCRQEQGFNQGQLPNCAVATVDGRDDIFAAHCLPKAGQKVLG